MQTLKELFSLQEQNQTVPAPSPNPKTKQYSSPSQSERYRGQSPRQIFSPKVSQVQTMQSQVSYLPLLATVPVQPPPLSMSYVQQYAQPVSTVKPVTTYQSIAPVQNVQPVENLSQVYASPQRAMKLVSLEYIESSWKTRCIGLERDLLDLQILVRKNEPQVVEDSYLTKKLQEEILDSEREIRQKDTHLKDLQTQVSHLELYMDHSDNDNRSLVDQENNLAQIKHEFMDLNEKLNQVQKKRIFSQTELEGLKNKVVIQSTVRENAAKNLSNFIKQNEKSQRDSENFKVSALLGQNQDSYKSAALLGQSPNTYQTSSYSPGQMRSSVQSPQPVKDFQTSDSLYSRQVQPNKDFQTTDNLFPRQVSSIFPGAYQSYTNPSNQVQSNQVPLTNTGNFGRYQNTNQ